MTAAGWPAAWVSEQLGYEPRDLALFRAALTHRSAPGPNNERLEFLGDAVLNLLIAHRLYGSFPQASEGDLSRLRARLVSREPLAEIALTVGLGETRTYVESHGSLDQIPRISVMSGCPRDVAVAQLHRRDRVDRLADLCTGQHSADLGELVINQGFASPISPSSA